MSLTKKIAYALTTFVIVSALHAQTVVMFHSSATLSAQGAQIRRLVESSGVSFQLMDVGPSPKAEREFARLSHSKVLAILLEAAALPSLDPHIQSRLRTPAGTPAPLMIFNVDAATDQRQLQLWSDGAIRGCIAADPASNARTIHVFALAPWTKTLSGTDLPAVHTPACKLDLAKENTKVVLAATSSSLELPTLVDVPTRRGDLFIVPRLQLFDRSWMGQPWGFSEAFSSVAPFLLFLRDATGEYAWHLDGQYANLTIDDPWLTEPYGNLNYGGLLSEMKKHQFHTTIAFVPWNYDRSDAAVAALFRSNREYLSICLHGNDHIHREFGAYSENPLLDQVADIKQSIVRMERFQRLTGVTYDRFMVFPHGVAPEATFIELKAYGFLGTANSLNVPLDRAMPFDPLFLLKPYTTNYGGLLSLSRYSVEAPIPQDDIAVQTFLGNPVLFYAHQGFFANGMTAFNSMADTVNRLQPETRWVDLGDLARHLYELRKRDDGDFDVRMLSNEMTLTNRTSREATYFVAVDATSDRGLPKFTVNGTPSEFQLTRDAMMSRVRLRPGESSTVEISYSLDWDPGRQSLQRKNLRSYALRYVSDFRDMKLSRSTWGFALVRSYYSHNGESLEGYLERRWYLPALLLLLALAALLPILRRHQRHLLQERNHLETSAQ